MLKRDFEISLPCARSMIYFGHGAYNFAPFEVYDSPIQKRIIIESASYSPGIHLIKNVQRHIIFIFITHTAKVEKSHIYFSRSNKKKKTCVCHFSKNIISHTYQNNKSKETNIFSCIKGILNCFSKKIKIIIINVKKSSISAAFCAKT